MVIWLDKHLSPRLARWLTERYPLTAIPVRELGLGRAPDRTIFERARTEAAAILTKDRDFADLAARFGFPPTIVIIGVGNSSTDHMVGVLASRMDHIMALVSAGEALVEIGPA